VVEIAGGGTDTLDFALVTSTSLTFNINATVSVTDGTNTVSHAGMEVEGFIGGAADDIFNITPSVTTAFKLNGGLGTDVLNFDAVGLVVTQTPTTLLAAGRQVVTHEGFESVVVLNPGVMAPEVALRIASALGAAPAVTAPSVAGSAAALSQLRKTQLTPASSYRSLFFIRYEPVGRVAASSWFTAGNSMQHGAFLESGTFVAGPGESSDWIEAKVPARFGLPPQSFAWPGSFNMMPSHPLSIESKGEVQS